VLIGGRALTGLGAALEVPTSLSILTVAYSDTKARAHAIGIWAGCNGLALAAGPTIGGLLVDAAGWRSIFVLVIPVCALGMLLAVRYVPDSRDPKGRALDPVGQALAIVALGSLAFVTIEGPHWGFVSPAILALAAVCVIASVAFVLFERGKAGALVPLEFFGIAQFNATLAAAGTMTFGMYALLFLTFRCICRRSAAHRPLSSASSSCRCRSHSWRSHSIPAPSPSASGRAR
jgi:MFS family permease